MTAVYECSDCHQRFEFGEDCILAIHPQDDCTPFARMIRICPDCATSYAPSGDYADSYDDDCDDLLEWC